MRGYQDDEAPIDRLLRALEAAGSEVRPASNGYRCNCPAHDDRRPSLTVNEGEDGRVLIYCHAGCSLDQVLAALRLDAVDLFADDGVFEGRIAATYEYEDEDGTLLFEVVRTKPKGFWVRHPDPDDADHWIPGLGGITPPLYRLPELIKAVEDDEQVWIVEGEKDVETLTTHGLAATCNAFGAGQWQRRYNEHFRGADVVVVTDQDDEGRTHARRIVHELTPIVRRIKRVRPGKGCRDATAHFEAGFCVDDFVPVRTREASEPAEKSASGRQRKGRTTGKATRRGRPRTSAASKLVDLALEAAECFVWEGRTYIALTVGDHRETWPLKSRHVKDSLTLLNHERYGSPPGATVLEQALVLLDAMARRNGDERQVHLRLAYEPEHGKIYVDLCDPTWRAVEIDHNGWRVVKDPPVHFVRRAGMQAMPKPEKGGTLDDLDPFINAKGDDLLLIKAWLISTYCPWADCVILMLGGEQGTGKTVATSHLTQLTDPNVAAHSSAPGNERDLAIIAQARRVLAFDNLSWIKPWLSDALCRMATGGAFLTRKLWSDDELTILTAKRPIVMNSIADLGSKGDLFSRTVLVTLDRLDNGRRRELKELQAAFVEAYPRLLGDVFAAVSTALRNYEAIQLGEVGRMSDFERWITAASPSFDPERRFLAAYQQNMRKLSEVLFESDPVAGAIVDLLSQELTWKGNAGTLLVALGSYGRYGSSEIGWPKTARGMAEKIRQLAPSFRTQGYTFEFTERRRQWKLGAPEASSRRRRHSG